MKKAKLRELLKERDKDLVVDINKGFKFTVDDVEIGAKKNAKSVKIPKADTKEVKDYTKEVKKKSGK